MDRRASALIVSLAFVVLVPGCATYGRVGKTFRHRKIKLQVDLPKEWLRYSAARFGYVMTRDGVRLEAIAIHVSKMGKKVRGTERVYRADMLPHELAKLTLSIIEARDEINDLRVENIELIDMAGREGYRADAVFKDEDGLRKRLRMYGVGIEGYLCEFRYEAADDVYFEKYADVFEDMVSSAAINE